MTAQRHTTGHAESTGRPRHTTGSTGKRPSGRAEGRLLGAAALRAAAAGALTVALLGIAPYAQAAGDDKGRAAPEPPARGSAPAAQQAASDDGTLKTLSRFFARDGAVSAKKADPRIVGKAVPVYTLSAGFVTAAKAGAARTPVAELEVFASEAVSSDGQRASVMAARTGGDWRVVNIATGDDETRYAAMGAKKAPGGTVFQEPQIDAWYVLRGTRVLPLDPDARKAVGAGGTSLGAFHQRVHAEYADKLPGSAYDRKGLAGGFGPEDHGGARVDGGAAAPGTRAQGPDADGPAAVQRAERAAVSRASGQGDAVGTVAATAGAGALVLGAAAGGTWLIRRRAGAARG
ncbi:hypothetical protein [Streptomyces iconiensis]|uniref:Uncharacterized protein n=1 Tax=Streptomyces iconiensis TaxID=1384038 RepID=A0ABT6ZVR7_9ACTN|nr:hypothetical protein [Streptomyces iconiensis]MDJ1133158.1 hypothetical protein [Streptomyces iconiensis]